MNFNEAFLIAGTIIANAIPSENHLPTVKVAKERATKSRTPRVEHFREVMDDDFWTMGYDHEAFLEDKNVIESHVARHMH